ncbi:MAG TPA: ABC exporter membrane fusion protein [Leptolyngbyaceae cyanobacterium]
MNFYLPFKSSGKVLLPISIIGVLVIGSLGIGQFFLTQAPKTNTVTANTQKKKNPITRVTALGRLEPKGEVITIGGNVGERIGKLLVKEGQQIKSGDVIAYLDSYQERLAEKNAAASQLEDARTRLQAETMFGKAQIQEAESRITQIKIPQLSEIAAQKATIAGIAADLKAKQRDLERFRFLQQQGAISQQALDDRALAVTSKQNELSSAEATLAKLEEARNTSVQNAQAQVESAQANMQLAQTKVQLASANSNLKLAIARLERTIIRAPISGQVLKVFAHTGEAIDNEGIMRIGNTEEMYVVAEVYETDVSKVKLNQKAVISSSAFPQNIEGVVEEIGLEVGKKDVLNVDPVAKIDSRVVEVKIRLKDSHLISGLTNLQVNVVINP